MNGIATNKKQTELHTQCEKLIVKQLVINRNTIMTVNIEATKWLMITICCL